MTDFCMIKSVSEKLAENFRQESRYDENRQERLRSIHRMMMVVAVIMSFVALYLSWTRNTQLGETTGMKVLYGFFAAMFGTSYIFFYYIRYLIDRDMIVRLDKAGVDISLKKALDSLPKSYIRF